MCFHDKIPFQRSRDKSEEDEENIAVDISFDIYLQNCRCKSALFAQMCDANQRYHLKIWNFKCIKQKEVMYRVYLIEI